MSDKNISVALDKAGLTDPFVVAAMSDDELLKVENLRTSSFGKIDRWLERYGVRRHDVRKREEAKVNKRRRALHLELSSWRQVRERVSSSDSDGMEPRLSWVDQQVYGVRRELEWLAEYSRSLEREELALRYILRFREQALQSQRPSSVEPSAA